MIHTVGTKSQDSNLPYFQRLWDRLLDPHRDMGTKLEELFEDETAEFDTEYAYLSRIDEDTETEHFEIVYGPENTLHKGDTAPLSVTYCRKTIAESDGTMCVNDALEEGWGDDPAYETFGFESYLGTTDTVEGDLYGTLCFADTAPRDEPISEEEITLVEMLGQWVSYELNQWTGPPTEETISENLDEREMPITPQIDAMMEALGRRPRRFILVELLDRTPENGLDVIDKAAEAEGGEIKMRHAHLPKLEQAGYIEWDRATNEIREGPNFSEIEPLLRLLKDYTDEFSGE